MTTRPRTAGAAVQRPTSTTTRPRAADAAGPPRPLWRARAAPPPPSHDCRRDRRRVQLVQDRGGVLPRKRRRFRERG
jgi:hypothetical protein